MTTQAEAARRKRRLKKEERKIVRGNLKERKPGRQLHTKRGEERKTETLPPEEANHGRGNPEAKVIQKE